MLESIIAAYIASHSPSSAWKTTLYGYRRNDPYPCTSKRIGRDDHLEGGRTIWHQELPRKVRSVAHRSWHLGTWVIFKNRKNGKLAVARITDRGPYPYKGKSGKAVPAGVFDLSYPIGVELCHSGRQRLQYWRVPWGSRLHRQLNRIYGACPKAKRRAPRWWKRKRKRCLERGRW